MDSWQTYSAFAKFALYLGALGATGLCLNVLLFAQYISGALYRRWIILFAAIGLLAAGVGFLLRGASLVGDWSGAIDTEILGILWETSVGSVATYRGVGFILILAGVLLQGRGMWLAVFGGSLVLWSFAQIGHVADKSTGLIQPVLLIHLAVASFWVGVLIPLRALARNPNTLAHAGELGHSFGRVAAWLIPALVLAGMYLTWQLVGSVAGLTSPYGLMLLAKLLCVAVLLGLGAANKLRFVPKLQDGNKAAARHLSNSIAVEWGVILIILAATALLTSSFSPLG